MNEKTNFLRQSHQLIEARITRMTALQAKLALYFTTLVPFESGTQLTEYKINYSDLAETIPGSKATKHFKDEVRKALDFVQKVQVRIPQTGGGYLSFCWFSVYQWSPDGTEFKFKMSNELIPHIRKMANCFQGFKYEHISNLKFGSSIRLYPILKKAENLHSVTYDLAELHDIVDSPNTYRKTWEKFKCRYLEPAKKDINKNTDIAFSYKTYRAGRGGKVKRVTFTVSTNAKKTVQKRQLPLPGMNTTKHLEATLETLSDELIKLDKTAYTDWKSTVSRNLGVSDLIDDLTKYIKKTREEKGSFS